MASAIRGRRLFGKTTVIGIGIGLSLWLTLVASLFVMPLDKGQSSPGIYALIGTLMPYENEDGERVVKQAYIPK